MLPPKRLCRVGHDVTTGSCADALDHKHILRHDEVPIDTTSSEQPKCDGVHAVLFESKIQTPRFRLQISSLHQTPGTQTPDTYSYRYLYPKPHDLDPDHSSKSLDHRRPSLAHSLYSNLPRFTMFQQASALKICTRVALSPLLLCVEQDSPSQRVGDPEIPNNSSIPANAVD